MFRSLAMVAGLLSAATGSAAHAQEKAKPAANAPAVAPEPRRVPDTLMFSIDELNEVGSRVATGSQADQENRNQAAIENASLYLSTILYYGPGDWTIWINGSPITPQQEFSAFEVTGIGPDFVELLIPLSAQGMRPVRLSPNQTFDAKSGVVVEGKWK